MVCLASVSFVWSFSYFFFKAQCILAVSIDDIDIKAHNLLVMNVAAGHNLGRQTHLHSDSADLAGGGPLWLPEH